jgi:hypothetical protein
VNHIEIVEIYSFMASKFSAGPAASRPVPNSSAEALDFWNLSAKDPAASPVVPLAGDRRWWNGATAVSPLGRLVDLDPAPNRPVFEKIRTSNKALANG